MRISKYINLNSNILLEYIYDDSNLIGEPYEILYNIKNNSRTFISTDTAATNNTIDNQLFQIDPITRNYGIVGSSSNTGDITNYNFLQLNPYAAGFPIKYDTIVIHLPINYTFGQYKGFYLKVYSFDTNNKITYDLCNFYFDISDPDTTDILNFTNPPILFQEQLWGKEIDIIIPSLFALSSQINANIPIINSINYNLTGGIGMSQQTPIFFEFSFINTKQIINSVTTYNLTSPTLTSLSQIPEFQNLGVVIQSAVDGDYYEIFGVYNNSIADFNTWINNSVYTGNRYYVNYIITMYEQNIRGDSFTITRTNNFNTPYKFRPIILTSTTTAIIDVEMDVIDSVDNSSIVRMASYGLLPNEVSKYSLNLTKINVSNATKSIIYNLNSVNNSNLSTVNNITSVSTNIVSATVSYVVLMNAANVVAKSNNVIVGNTTFYGDGKLVILIKPFDNIIQITIASNVITQNNSITPHYMDLSSLGIIQLTFKNNTIQDNFDIYLNNGNVNLANGTVVFLIPSSKINDLRTIYTSGVNVFYVTSTQNNITTVIYSGLFTMYDATDNVASLNSVASQLNSNLTSANNNTPFIISSTPTNINSLNLPQIVKNQLQANALIINNKQNISPIAQNVIIGTTASNI